MLPWLNERLRASHGARPATVLVSRSEDGEMVARYLVRFGLDSVRGSTSRGGAEAGRALVAGGGRGGGRGGGSPRAPGAAPPAPPGGGAPAAPPRPPRRPGRPPAAP